MALHRRIWIAGAALVALLLAFATLRPASKLLINDSCELDGPVAKLKSIAQGRAFWERQREYLESQIAWLPERQAQIDKFQAEAYLKTDELLKKHDQRMEKLYERYPAIRPPPPSAARNQRQ